MSPESRTEQALMLIANALSKTEVNNIVNQYRLDILLDANAIIDAGIKRIEELD